MDWGNVVLSEGGGFGICGEILYEVLGDVYGWLEMEYGVVFVWEFFDEGDKVDGVREVEDI